MRWYLVFPFLSSLLYVAGVLLIKRSAAAGVGVWRTTVVSNLVAALVFVALVPFGGEPVVAAKLWQPLVVALLFVGGQGLTFLAIDRGDVSVATPAMGVKTLCVAWFSVLLLPVSVPWQLWVSALMTFLAIALLNARPGAGGVDPRGDAVDPPAKTIMLALLAAGCYAMFDVLVQKWSGDWGAGRFLPVMFGIAALLSLGFVPLFRAPLSAIPREAWPWLLWGSLLVGLQALFLVTCIAVFGDATAVNVIYSARGLWSVVAVWLIGHWFASREQSLAPRVLRLRLAGAALMTAAIVVTLTRGGGGQ